MIGWNLKYENTHKYPFLRHWTLYMLGKKKSVKHVFRHLDSFHGKNDVKSFNPWDTVNILKIDIGNTKSETAVKNY